MISFANVLLFSLSLKSFLDKTISQQFHEENLCVPDFIRENGYVEETHTVKSKSGYLTTLHRIPNGRYHGVVNGTKNATRKPAILLYHGLAQSSVHWLFLGPNNSLGFLLANEGFDVWLSNLRGNVYSNKHTSMNSKDKAYWDYSFHEMGDEDLVATIDHVLNTTGQKKLYMIGYNFGNTVIYTGLALHPEYHDKVRLLISLAPLAFLSHARSPWMTAAQQPTMALFFEMLQLTFGITTYPISEASIPMYRSFYKDFCAREAKATPLCTHISYLGMDPQHSVFSVRLRKNIWAGSSTDGSPTGKWIPSTTPSLHSFKTAIHLAQIASSHRFQLFDYRIKNMEIYRMIRPPNYKVYSIKTPVAVITSVNDILSDTEDIQTLVGLLPNVFATYNVPSSNFSHRDFMYSLQANELVYQECIRLIKQCEQNDTLCVQINE